MMTPSSSIVGIVVLLLVSLPAAAHASDEGESGDAAGEASSSRIPASVWIAGTAAGGLATTTTILGLAALDLRSDFDRANRDARQSVDARTDLRNMTLDAQHLATIAGLATIAAAATAIVFYFARPMRSAPSARLSLPIVGERLMLSGSF